MRATTSSRDAYARLVGFLRPLARRQQYTHNPLTFSLLSLIHETALQIFEATPRDGNEKNAWERCVQRESPPFEEAAWELARRGLIRPRMTYRDLQTIYPESNAAEWTITDYGRECFANLDPEADVVSVAPSHLGELFDAPSRMLGSAYSRRSQEAIRCYLSGTYLASCTMSGAAAESALFTVASVAWGVEESLKRIRAKGGRQRVIHDLATRLDRGAGKVLESGLEIMLYWRDDAAHWEDVSFGEPEAYTGLLTLLRFSRLLHDRWERLTAKEGSAA